MEEKCKGCENEESCRLGVGEDGKIVLYPPNEKKLFECYPKMEITGDGQVYFVSRFWIRRIK